MKLNIKVFVLILIFSAVLFQPVFSQEKETLNPLEENLYGGTHELSSKA